MPSAHGVQSGSDQLIGIAHMVPIGLGYVLCSSLSAR